MVGAEDLAGTAADIQEYADAYTDAELAAEMGKMGRRARELKHALAATSKRTSLSPPWAS
jgi:hypothetical protein